MLNYFKSRGLTYSYLDVDPAAVNGSRLLAEQVGLTNASFALGFNNNLDFPDASFDAIFSSHCIEHSMDLSATFRELNRVLKAGGNLLMAVPFGWEPNPEHPYFFGPDEWVSLVEDGGFRIRVAQIGNEYSEIGEDYFIAATKIAEPQTPSRIDPRHFLKDDYKFFEHTASAVIYSGEFDQRWDAAISASPVSSLEIAPPAGAVEILPIMHRHSWSGIVRLSQGLNTNDCDLYSWFAYDMPVRFALDGERNEPMHLELVGKSAASLWSQFVFKGFFWR